MEINLLQSTNLHIPDLAISKCWDKSCDPNNVNTDKINRIANKMKHASTIEHIVYSFEIKGITRSCLQELSRHRVQSLSVESSRYTLKNKLKRELPFLECSCLSDSLSEIELHTEDALTRAQNYIKFTGTDSVDIASLQALDNLRDLTSTNVTNDIIKFNARSLQNFLALRSAPSALWEIRDLANAIYDTLPSDHKFLFTHIMEPDDEQSN